MGVFVTVDPTFQQNGAYWAPTLYNGPNVVTATATEFAYDIGSNRVVHYFGTGFTNSPWPITGSLTSVSLVVSGVTVATFTPTSALDFSIAANQIFVSPTGEGNGQVFLAALYAGADTFDGGNLGDGFAGFDGADNMNGLDGNDVLNGGAGADNLYGNAGNDSLNGGADGDQLFGGEGNDSLSNGGGGDVLYGEAGNDTIFTSGDGALAQPGIGQDKFFGGSGADGVALFDGDVEAGEIYDGGGGFDTLKFGNSAVWNFTSVTLTNFERFDLNFGGGARHELYLTAAQVASLTASLAITGGVADDLIEITLASAGSIDVSGWQLSNWNLSDDGSFDLISLNGSSGGDVLIATRNNDWLTGGGGDDSLNGGRGADILDGGDGVDTATYAGAPGRVVVSLAQNELTQNTAGGGFDTLIDIENLMGSAYADRLSGNAGANSINGGVGADRMIGGAGNDIYFVDNSGDAVVEASGAGSDTVRSSASFYELAPNVENLILQGAVSGAGNVMANKITGTGGVNFLDGAAGNDVLLGEGSNDFLNGGVGMDSLSGGAGSDTFAFDAPLIDANRDTITDFATIDTIYLANTVFTGLGAAGGLTNAAYFQGPAAHDVDDRIIYNPANGALIYDPNGDAVGGAVQFATLALGLTLTNADFFVFDPSA